MNLGASRSDGEEWPNRTADILLMTYCDGKLMGFRSLFGPARGRSENDQRILDTDDEYEHVGHARGVDPAQGPENWSL